MKIFFVTNHLKGTDGWSKYSFDMIKRFSETPGVEVVCIVNELSNKGFIEIKLLKPPLYYLANPLRCLIDGFKLRRVIKKHNPDILHFEVEPYVYILPFLGSQKPKNFLCIHGTFSFIPNLFSSKFKRFISGFLFKKSYNRLNGIISVSEFTKKYFEESIEKLVSKSVELEVIKNGIDFDLLKIEVPKRNNLIKRMLFVGGVKKRKGVLEAIEGINFYKNNYSSDFIFNIVGHFEESDPYIVKIKEKILTYGLEDRIFLRGSLSDADLDREYLTADLLIMTSLNNGREFEGFGLVYLEANAKGIPVIGSKDSGAEEAIVDGKTGFLVNPLDANEIALRISDILLNNKIKPEECIDWSRKNDIAYGSQKTLGFYKKSLVSS